MPIHQLSFNSLKARMSFSQSRVLIVENYLPTHSYLTCHYDFTKTSPDSPVQNKSNTSHQVNHFHDTECMDGRNHSIWPLVFSDNFDICQTLLRSPQKSLTKLSFQSKLSYGNVHKAKMILKLHPYCVCHAWTQETW